MNIGLIDADSHNFPNLALMKISAYHKSRGDSVDWVLNMCRYDRVYKAKVFTDTYSQDDETVIYADEVICGGTGYGLDSKLTDEIEHIYPDYSLYPQYSEAYGFLTRGCPRNCPFCIVTQKEGAVSRQVADLSEFWRGQKVIMLLDPNLLACKEREKLLIQLANSRKYVDFTQGLDARLLTPDINKLLSKIHIKCLHFAWDSDCDSDLILRNLERLIKDNNLHYTKICVYVLTNYNTSLEFDLERIYALRDIGANPYVMIYDRPNAPRVLVDLARYTNSKRIFRSIGNFEDYKPGRLKRV